MRRRAEARLGLLERRGDELQEALERDKDSLAFSITKLYDRVKMAATYDDVARATETKALLLSIQNDISECEAQAKEVRMKI